jgi:hypothetical protein
MMSPKKAWTVFVGVATVDAVLLIKLLTGEPSTELLLAVVVVTTLLIFSFRLEDITDANVTKNGLEIKLQKLDTKVNATNDKLKEAQAEIEANKEKVDNLFLLSMGPDIYTNLKKIASGHFGKYYKPNAGGLDRELRHLRNIGYVEVKDNSISEIPEHGENLSEYVWATETGKDFVTLRESVEQRKMQANNSNAADG